MFWPHNQKVTIAVVAVLVLVLDQQADYCLQKVWFSFLLHIQVFGLKSKLQNPNLCWTLIRLLVAVVEVVVGVSETECPSNSVPTRVSEQECPNTVCSRGQTANTNQEADVEINHCQISPLLR